MPKIAWLGFRHLLAIFWAGSVPSDDVADESNQLVRRTLIQTKIFLAYRKQLANLHSQEARLRRQRLQDENRLKELQADRRSEEAKKEAVQKREKNIQHSDRRSPKPQVGFEFQSANCAARTTPVSYLPDPKQDVLVAAPTQFTTKLGEAA